MSGLIYSSQTKALAAAVSRANLCQLAKRFTADAKTKRALGNINRGGA